MGLVALHGLAALTSSFPGHCLQELARLAALVSLYVTAAQVYRTPAQVRGFMLATVAAVAVSTAYGFVQRAGLDPFPLETPGDPLHLAMPGTFGNPNYAAHAHGVHEVSRCRELPSVFPDTMVKYSSHSCVVITDACEPHVDVIHQGRWPLECRIDSQPAWM